MANIIDLFNPNDKPFGRLSNNSYHPMIINGKKYDTVTNYIYSNMLTTPILRTMVQNAKIGDVKGINKELMESIDFLSKSNTMTQEQQQSKRLTGFKRLRNVQALYLSRVNKKPVTKYNKLSDKSLFVNHIS